MRRQLNNLGKKIMMTYNEFKTACKEAWRTEGHGNINIQEAHRALLACEKTTRMSKTQVMSAAWQFYKNGH